MNTGTQVREIAVLCGAVGGVYCDREAVELFDQERDVRTFTGGKPVVAHPPCRSWSLRLAHQAKPEPGEKELGPLCVAHVRTCGGVLEHPAHSRLFEATGMPRPGQGTDAWGGWTLGVWQAWWGHPTRKATWLYFCGIEPGTVQTPFRLLPAMRAHQEHRFFQYATKAQKSATPPEMADWLIQHARNAR
jgi:hypothetical protein